MDELEGIYEHLHDLGICKSQAEFSQSWLGKSEGYFAYLKSTKEPVCLSAIGMLIGRIECICPTTDQSRYFEERMRLRLALKMARTIYRGEWELRYVPEWARVTAI